MPFIVHSRHSFLFGQNFYFSVVVFFHMHFDIDFKFFKKFFDLIFVVNCFPNSFIVLSRSSFCFVNENF